jgi:hypothetical protein
MGGGLPARMFLTALALGAAGAPFTRAQTPREAALAILERASRPFAAYCARSGSDLVIVAELSAASIQAGRWKEGADIEAVASAADDTPVAKAHGRIDPGAYATTIRLPLRDGVLPAHVSVSVRGESEKPAEDWVKIYPPTGTLVGDPFAYRTASRIAARPVAAFEFARNERVRVEWPDLAPIERREVRLLNRAGKVLLPGLPVTADSAHRITVFEMGLSNLPHGDYLLELIAGAGETTESHLLALRIR